jgi:hypothetical protein
MAHSAEFKQIVVLAAEVNWRRGAPQLVRVPLDYGALASAHREIGLALRIGPYSGPFASTEEPIEALCGLAASLVSESQDHQVGVSELQIDFDCADSKLRGYKTWVEAMRRKLKPVPVTITSLPSWIRQPGFKDLIEATDGYVLQVHSLERPKSVHDPFTLCDPQAARRAVESAGQFSVPFRVALPTYGYLVAFDSSGKFLGLSAEGPARSSPDTVQTREVRADPTALAYLLQTWNTSRPTALQGIIWYRLPTDADALNWPWLTLAAVMKGRAPKSQLRAQTSLHPDGLVDLELINEGERDLPLPTEIVARWKDARLVAGDALQGFELVQDKDAGAARFKSGASTKRLPPGGHYPIGWLRLSKRQEVHVEF